MIQRKRIGDILLEEGRVTEEQIEIAVKEQKMTGELLGAILFSHGFITQQDLFRVLSLTHSDPGKPKAQDESLEVPEEIESLVKQSSIVFQTDSGLERKHVDSAQSPLVRLVDKIIITGIKQSATDIHVGPDARGTRVRYRVDGALHHGMLLPRNLLNPIISRFKILGHMNIAENRVPQDGSAEFLHKDKKLDLRISTFPLINGENIVARILDKSQLKLGLDTLGFQESDIQRIIDSSIKKEKILDDLLLKKEPKQLRIVLRNCGKIDPESIDEYISNGGYQALKKVLFEMTPEKVVDELKKSGLRGRGGAGYPTWMKWKFTRASVSKEKFVICNADEGDPGAYMDRSVLEGDPHSVIEGLIIGAYTMGASKGYWPLRA